MLKMFSIAHDQVANPLPSGWIEPFAIGDLARASTGYTYRDNGGGDNIARLHSCFSELTAHYWAWKNLEKTEYIGFCHYRRYFNLLETPQIHVQQLVAQGSPEVLGFLNQDEQKQRALQILQTSDVIAPRQSCLPTTIRDQFYQNHPSFVWDEFVRVVEQVSPPWLNKYLPWFDVAHEIRWFPIFITRWEIFEEYCTLLFDVLFLVFQRIGALAPVDGARFQPTRYPAFLAERFLMLYLHAKGLRVYGAQLVILQGA